MALQLPVFTLKVYSALPAKVPLDLCQFSPFTTQITITTGKPGGYMGCSVGFAEEPISLARGWPYLPQPVFVEPLAHVEVWCGASLLFEGRLVETDTLGQRATAIRAEGYALQALNDAPWYPLTNSEDATYYSSGRLLLQALTDTCPLVRPMALLDFTDPGILHQYSEINGKTAAQLVQQFSTEGNGFSLFDFMMWERRRPEFLARAAPLTPDYREDVGAGVVIQTTYSDLVGTVYVRYSDPITGRTNQIAGPFTDPTFAARFGGLSRAKEINGGTMSPAGATAFGQTYLSVNRNPTYRVQIQRDGWQGLRNPSGGAVAPHWVRADQWTEVGGMVLPIIRSDCNLTAGQATYQLGANPVNWLEQNRQTVRVVNAVSAGLNSNTYARS